MLISKTRRYINLTVKTQSSLKFVTNLIKTLRLIIKFILKLKTLC